MAPSPTFSLYRLLTNVLGGRYVPVPLGPDFEFDVDALIEAAVRERARVVVLNSPNNPTGSALPEGAVERVLAETGALVVCDEAYQDFGGPSAIPLLRRTSRLVVLRTFSKALGMAGLRFGLALAHPAVAREIAKGKLPYNVNLVTLAAAAAALRHADVLAARTREIVETRERFARAARAASRGSTLYPERGQLRAHPAASARPRGRCSAGSRRPRHPRARCLGSPELADCLRISIGTPEDMDAAAAALEQILG